MLFKLTYPWVTILVILSIVFEAVAAEPAAVTHRSMGMELGESAHFDRLLNVVPGQDGLSLAAGTTQGLAADSAASPVTATHLGLSWSAKYNGGAVGLAARTSVDGVHWSEWVEVRIDEHLTDHENHVFYSRLITVPGGYRYVQYSAGLERTQSEGASPVLTALDLSFIDAGGSAADGPESVITDQPPMVSRTGWGCPDGETSSNNPNPTYTDPTHLIVHHTATSNTATDWAAEVRAMWSYHVNTRGWADIGYNFLVDPDGVIYVGRAGGDNVQGAHFSCQNGGTQGVAVIGDFTDTAPTDAALDATEDLLAWLASREGLDPVAVTWHSGTRLDLPVIAGHRDGNASETGCTVTACPGDTFYPMLPEVRVNVEALIAAVQVPDPVIEDQQSEVVAAFTDNSAAAGACWGVFEINGQVLANLHMAGTGCRLYRIEESGERVMLADINTAPRQERQGSTPLSDWGSEPPFRGWYYFEGASHSNGFWRTDGVDVEAVLADEDWPQGGVVTGRGPMNGRLYFTVETADETQYFFSTDGQAYRAEPVFPGVEGENAELVGSALDTLLFTGRDETSGREPWVFDGSEYRILQDMVPGETGSYPRMFLMLDDHWYFIADRPDGSEAYFRTDGDSVSEVPDPGGWADLFDTAEPAVKAAGAQFIVHDLPPSIPDPPVVAPINAMRLTPDSVSVYALGDIQTGSPAPGLAVLGDDALALAENHFFRLGETAAEELPYNFPTDQDGVELLFVGSNPNFPFTFVKEIEYSVASRVWAWTPGKIGRLLAGENNEITDADHFTHIGGDIWFYGEDPVNGRALRRIPGIAQAPSPWMGAVTGAWYDPATDGQGFVLHPIDDTRSVVSFYGYENDGSQLWLLGTGEIGFETGVPAEVQMFRSSGGNFGNFTPEQIDTQPWGTLRVTFPTCREATIELDGETGQQGLQTIRLAGLAGLECQARTPPLPDVSGVTGTWYEPATSGQGFVLHAIDASRILVSFYGYRDDGRRLWLLGVFEGDPGFGRPLTVDMTLAEGGAFGNFDPAAVTRSAWGTLSITFEDCDNAAATLDGVDGRQSLDLLKLAGLRGSTRTCPGPDAETTTID